MGSFDTYPDEERWADDNTAAATAGHVFERGGPSLGDMHGIFQQLLRVAYESNAHDGSAQTLAYFGRRILDVTGPKLHPEGDTQ